MSSKAKGFAGIGVVLCAAAAVGVLLGALLASGDADAAKKRHAAPGSGTCSCECRSDERMDGVFGRPSRYSEGISFEVSNSGLCRQSEGGGCHFKRNGVEILGTARACSFRENSNAASKGDIAPSDQTPDGSLRTFQRPGSIFSP